MTVVEDVVTCKSHVSFYLNSSGMQLCKSFSEFWVGVSVDGLIELSSNLRLAYEWEELKKWSFFFLAWCVLVFGFIFNVSKDL